MDVDETWAHHYETENKAQSRQWVGPGSPRSKKFKTQPSAGKAMATLFWDAKGVIFFWTFSQEKCDNWSVLCKLARLAENRHP